MVKMSLLVFIYMQGGGYHINRFPVYVKEPQDCKTVGRNFDKTFRNYPGVSYIEFICTKPNSPEV